MKTHRSSSGPGLPFAALLVLIALGWTCACRAQTQSDPARLLEAIHQLENPDDLPTPGPCGELGAYQFREATWKRYSSQPFARALVRSESDRVAMRHYDWLRRRLYAAGVSPDAYHIALAWNAGIGSVIRGKACRGAQDYARRAVNLAGALAPEAR